eukprot:CAMPEP_0174378862 /NCGR_PEP_ID=MMETSP0811_2-20130205/122322_1 /TAXON_ID=73025 ORGANISM="Eutreptiella gymnastica-like, Strain CCMP1594" /NCGR_SAMPLE_ID=MMETSP0811_2 /ASSEMBLY_ACC=CAM_ASM_000667 /LENGTH=172 /DNA_ID=CAMNT_0015531199 /DNA_START=377 /DNA_END=894 /DNA_ORIENTATION=-
MRQCRRSHQNKEAKEGLCAGHGDAPTGLSRGLSRACQGLAKGLSSVCQGLVKGLSSVCQGLVQGLPRACAATAAGSAAAAVGVAGWYSPPPGCPQLVVVPVAAGFRDYCLQVDVGGCLAASSGWMDVVVPVCGGCCTCVLSLLPLVAAASRELALWQEAMGALVKEREKESL